MLTKYHPLTSKLYERAWTFEPLLLNLRDSQENIFPSDLRAPPQWPSTSHNNTIMLFLYLISCYWKIYITWCLVIMLKTIWRRTEHEGWDETELDHDIGLDGMEGDTRRSGKNEWYRSNETGTFNFHSVARHRHSDRII